MSALLSGTVTFLFTDIEGSTQLWEQHPEAMKSALAKHDSILHAIFESQHGHVFKTMGDAFYAAFESPIAALTAAIEAQQTLQKESWGETVIKVRMALHCGEAETRDNDYFGQPLNRVARLLSTGHGGQVLISTAMKESLGENLSQNISLRDMGERRLKDLIRPEHIYQLVIPNLPADFPPLKTLDAFRTNLPAQLTSFIGRETEIADVKQEVVSHRLVTLTGSGGTGKTRLSLQIAAELLDQFQNGVWFIELAPLTDPDLIPQTILSAIGISEQPDKTLLEVLKEYLQDKKTLIVLDNCEHLVSASAQVANDLLNTAPGLKILASSREALGVKGEVSYPVPSLSLPDLKHLPEVEQFSQYEAVRLFIERVMLVAPRFAVNKDNAPYIAQICHRLDGIPLAIELAAAKIRVLNLEQIAKRLDDRFRLLTGGVRTVLPRQQTLRAAIDWSYILLSEQERTLLRRLAVFMGGWTLEAAEEVCAGEGIESIEILDLMSQLVNKSLVAVDQLSKNGETRYRILETIRQYAREKLFDTEEVSSTRDKHLAYFAKLTKEAEPELYRSNQVFWFNKLDDELDNFRMAIEWALTTNVELGLQIASTPWRFWLARGFPADSGDWLQQLLERYATIDILHAHALTVYSFWNFRRGNLPKAMQLIKTSLQMAHMLADMQTEAFSLRFLGTFKVLQGYMGDELTLLEQSLALFRTVGDKIGQADVLIFLAVRYRTSERSTDLSREAIRLYRELGDLFGITDSLINLARLAIWQGDFLSVAPMLEEAITTSRQIGSQLYEMEAIQMSGILAYWRGDYKEALALYEESIGISEKIGHQYQNIWGHVYEAYAILRLGDIQKARAIFEYNIQKTQKAGLTIALVYTVEGVASLCIFQEKYERAVQLFAWATMMRDKIGDHRVPVEQNSVDKDLAVIHSRLNDDEFVKLSAEGRALTTEQAIALALEEIQ